jgi:hypothetical protein
MLEGRRFEDGFVVGMERSVGHRPAFVGRAWSHRNAWIDAADDFG